MSEYSAVAPPPPQQNFNQSSAFAAALQRAKQIAAKINPAGNNTGDTRKRSLEDGSEPDAKKGPGLSQSNNQGPPPLGRPPQNPGGIGMGGPVNEDIQVPDKMVGIIIGRGGEKITKLQAMSGCKIQMAPDSLGMPDRICSLSGTSEAVNKAKELIMNLIHQRVPSNGAPDEDIGPPGTEDAFYDTPGGNNMGGGNMGGPGPVGGRNTVEIMIPGPKVGLIIGKGGETIKQLQEKSGAKMVVIQDGPAQEHEKPLVISGDPQKVEYAKQLVYDLIAEKEMKNFNRRPNRNQQDGYNEYGGGNGGGGGGSELEVLVPRPAVGVVIGKGGDMIKKIQAETGARVQFQQARDEGPGDRRCYLSGNPKQVEQARLRIEELIDSVLQRDGDGSGAGGGGGGVGAGPVVGGGGRGGRGGGRGGRGGGGHMGDRFGRDRNGGAGGGGDFGANQWEDRRGGGGGHHQGAQQEVTFSVPANKCGVVIGRGGETIKQINMQSGAYCELDRRNQNPNASEKTFTIKGDPDQIETAKRIIQDKVQMPLNFIVSGGGPGPMANNMPTAYPGMAPQGFNPQSNWGVPGGYQQQQWGGQPANTDQQAPPQQQVQINPSTGQPDYSLQWAEYYRSLGMLREAEMIEQQAKAKQAGGAAPATMPQAGAAAPMGGVQPAPGATAGGSGGSQPDYSAQWAEYYRSIGKMKEAEAIEAQMKNKGSGSGSQPAPTGGAPTAPGQPPAGSYQQPYGAYQPPAGYYGGQPQGTPVPGGVPQAGYGFPGYNYGGQQNNAPAAPNSDGN